eukprot:191128_1
MSTEHKSDSSQPTAVHTFINIDNITIDNISQSFNVKFQLNVIWLDEVDMQRYEDTGIMPQETNHPEFIIINGNKQQQFDENVNVKQLNGKTYFTKNSSMQLNVNNPFNLKQFPFDVQNCQIGIQLTNDMRDFDFQHPPINNSEFILDLTTSTSSSCEWYISHPSIEFGHTKDNKHGIIFINVKASRNWMGYVWFMFVPLCLINFMAMLSFSIHLDEGTSDRLSYGISLFFCIIAYQWLINNKLPIRGLTYLDYYILFILYFNIIILIQTSVVGYVWEDDIDELEKMDKMCFYIFFILIILLDIIFFVLGYFIRQKEKETLSLSGSQFIQQTNKSERQQMLRLRVNGDVTCASVHDHE